MVGSILEQKGNRIFGMRGLWGETYSSFCLVIIIIRILLKIIFSSASYVGIAVLTISE